MQRAAVPVPPGLASKVQALEAQAGPLPTGCTDRPCVLLLDDSRGGNTATTWGAAFTAAGVAHSTVTVSAGSSCGSDIAPGDFPSLSGWDLVVVTFGDQAYSNLSAGNASALAAYLDGGGRLVMAGMHVAYDEPNAATLYGDYLAIANYTFSMPAGTWTLTPTGHEICGSAPLTIGFANPAQPCWSDMGSTWDVAPGGQACAVHTGTKHGLSTRDTQSYRTVAIGFELSQLPTAERNGLVQRTRDWMFRPHSVAGGPFTCQEGVSCSLTATAADLTGLDLTFEWDLDNDGDYDDHVGATAASTFAGVGTKTVKVKVSNAYSHAEATFSVDVVANQAPVAQAGSVITSEDNPVSVTLTGSDPEGNPFTFTVDASPVNGTLTGVAPNLIYTPHPDFHGSDAFTFTVNDGGLTSNTATVSITVTPVNDGPTVSSMTLSTDEDTPATVTLSVSDADGDALSYTVVTAPTKGTLSGTLPNLVFTPHPDANGADAFTLTVSDGTDTSNLATVDVTIAPVNDAPVAHLQTLTIDEDSHAVFSLTATDVDGDPVTFTIATQPAHGALLGTPPNLMYHPHPHLHGTDSFQFLASDGTLDSAPATIEITVVPVNDVPVAQAQSVTTAEDASVTITLTATDADGDSLTYAIVSGPAHGTLSGGTGAERTYTPATDYHGPDSFTFKVSDGSAESGTVTVSLTVNPVNDAPSATPQAATTAEDSPAHLTLAGVDLEGDSLSFSVAVQPQHGTVTLSGADAIYTPDPDYHGNDAFSFTVNDGALDSGAATVSLTVTPVNDAPVASAQTVVTSEEVARSITLGATDVDGDPLSFAIVTPPAHGTLSGGTGAAQTYTPAANYHGPDSFTFKANDGTTDSNIVTVSITVDPVNDVPVANAQSVTLDEDTTATIVLGGADLDGDSLSFVVVVPPAHGTLGGTAPNLTYAPDADYHGPDTFTFKANDGTESSVEAAVSITVSPVNDAPVSQPQSITVNQGEALDIVLAATDADGDALSYAVVQPPAEGSLTGTPPNLSYVAPLGFRGEATFTFKASDGQLESSEATVVLTVDNGAPTVTVSAELLEPSEGQPVKFFATAADPGGDFLTFTWDFGDGASSMEQNPTHAFDIEGPFTVTVEVSDGLETALATVEINVKNGAPILVPGEATVTGEEATELDFVVDARDPGAADTLTVVWHWGDGTEDTTGPAAKHVFADNGTYQVTVTATDNDGASVIGTREVVITNVPPIPEQQETLKVTVGETATAQLKATDRAGEHDPLTWELVEGPGTLAEDGSYTFTPEAEGSFLVKARVSDGDEGTAESVFTVEASPSVQLPESGCGCNSTQGASLVPVMLTGLLAVIRRRRRSWR